MGNEDKRASRVALASDALEMHDCPIEIWSDLIRNLLDQFRPSGGRRRVDWACLTDGRREVSRRPFMSSAIV